MLARPSPRLFLLTVGIFLFFFLLTTNRGFDPKTIKSNIPSTSDIWKASNSEAAKPSPAVKKFWAKWATIFHDTRPQVAEIKVKTPASTAGSDDANGEREPHPQNLNLSKVVVDALHDAHRSLLQDRGGLYGSRFNNKSSEIFSGTGIVTLGGGPNFPSVITSIRMTRKVTSLPIHVFLLTGDDYETPICKHVLPSLNAQCFILSHYSTKDTPIKPTHAQLKALAILFSSFETILYLDSDCFPVLDPSEILSSEPFTSTGLITWPDYWIATEDPTFYTIAGLSTFPTSLPGRSTETGSLLVSKNLHLSTLLLACYYNIYGPTHYYPLLLQGALGDGNKETFLAAAVVLGLPYYSVKEHVGTMGYFTPGGDFKGGAMVQHHPVDDSVIYNGTHASAKDSGKVRPFLIHAHFPKLNPARVLDENVLTSPTGKAIRIWGKKEDVERKFGGRDMEREVWKEMKGVGCELEGVVRDWRGRTGVCTRVREHWGGVFDSMSFLSGIV